MRLLLRATEGAYHLGPFIGLVQRAFERLSVLGLRGLNIQFTGPEKGSALKAFELRTSQAPLTKPLKGSAHEAS